MLFLIRKVGFMAKKTPLTTKFFKNESIFQGWREFLADNQKMYRIEMNDITFRFYEQQKNGDFYLVGTILRRKQFGSLKSPATIKKAFLFFENLCERNRRFDDDCEMLD